MREGEVHPTAVCAFIHGPHWSTQTLILRNTDCRRLSQRDDEHLICESRFAAEILRPVNSSALFECLSNCIRLLAATPILNRNRALRHDVEERSRDYSDPLTRNITHLLKEWSEGDQQALDELTPLVYEELRQQAARYLRKERPNHSLQATALINEAFLRLIDVKDVQWQNRALFFAIAANLMRRILVDHARRRDAEKRGGSQVCLTLDEGLAWANEPDVDLLAIDEALDRLAIIDEQQARIVELRFFSGLTVEETATALGVSPKTVKRDWSVARAWLKREIGG